MEQYQLTFTDYLAILHRRAWLIAGTFAGALAFGVAVALLIPPVYRSSGSILIESQQIPTEMVQSAVTSYADERIEVIKQRVMTRDNLLLIIRKYNLFTDMGPAFTPSEQIDAMRKTIAVDLVNANLRPDRAGPVAIAFSISFEHRRPEIAQAVANDLLTLFLEENVKVRTQRASQTTEFLTQEADKLKKDLDGLEAQIASYKQANGAGLPENVALGMAAMQRVEADLRQADRDHAAAEDALRSLEAERSAPPPVEPVAAAPATASDPELQRARAELARLAATYTENHPDLKIARRKVEILQQAVLAEAAALPAAPRRAARGDGGGRNEGRAAALRNRLGVLGAQRVALRAKLAQLDGAIARSPQTERGLLVLARDYQSAQRKYEEILAKKMTAQVAENLEGDQKAERFRLLEPPVLPDKPIRPDRTKLLALSLFLALAAAAAAVVLVEALHGTVRGVGQITSAVGQTPLVALPFIPVASEVAQRRKLIYGAMGGSVLAGCVALALVHFLVVPVDLLVMKAIIRLG